MYLGVTPPISLASPTARDLQISETLVETLRSLGQYESEEEAQKREVVLGKLSDLFKEFVRKVSLAKSLPESIANEAGGKIFTFGSYRLGVHGSGADIDTLCVAPVHIDRDDFFAEMYRMLKERPEVSDLTAVPDAYVPVINFSFSDIPIDLLFARLNLPSIPDDLDLADNHILKNLDEKCIRSLNGSRVTDEILRLVPKVDSFRTALRCIKVWARKRAVYSNVMGFFGGVAWAMVVARVCQLYPNAAAGTIVAKFFGILQQWKWPHPVLLKAIEDGPLQVRVWNPRIYPQDRSHRMPIITPAYPSMCSTHNVTASTQAVMIKEFSRGNEITEKIMLGTATWLDLLEKDDFFYSYRYYIQIIASSDSAEIQLKWAGLVEAKLRQLVMKLELIDSIELAHPYIKGFEGTYPCYSEQEADNVAHGVIVKRDQEPTGDPLRVIHSSSFYIGLSIAPKDPNSNIPRKLDISWPILEFTKMVKSWDSYDESCMGITTQFIKSANLPHFVFGEEGPQPNLKKRLKLVRMAEDIENTAKKIKASEDEGVDRAKEKEQTVLESGKDDSGKELPQSTEQNITTENPSKDGSPTNSPQPKAISIQKQKQTPTQPKIPTTKVVEIANKKNIGIKMKLSSTTLSGK